MSENQLDFIGGPTQQQMIHVPVHASTAVVANAIPAQDISLHVGPSLIVTTLLNGCTFCVADVGGGSILVAHVQPVGGESSAALRLRLGGGNFAGHGAAAVTCFGGGGHEYDQTVCDVTILGVRNGASVKFYAQRHTRNSRDILEVTRFFSA